MAIATFQVQGMSCQHCVQAIKKAVGGLANVIHTEVELTTGLVTIHYAEEQMNTQELYDLIYQTITDQGYEVIEA